MSLATTSNLKKLIGAFAIALSLTVLTGCGSGRTAATSQIKQVTDGVEGQIEQIKIRNLLVVQQDTATAVLVGTIVNVADESDTVTSITINKLPALITAKSLELSKNSPLIFVGESTNADAYVNNLTEVVGHRIPVTITFAKAAPLTLDALIVSADGIYADFNNLRTKS
jgi:hypothetical protein